METIYKKLAQCKKDIKNTKMKKEGKNTFSNYTYFTPTQIEELVSEVCEKNNLITKFDLNRNEFGVFGVLTIIDIETSEKIDFTMASAIPEIKATNIAQQLGGCVTYTERYLKTSAFGIVDNSLDFDTSENTKKQATQIQETSQEKALKMCKTKEQLAGVWATFSKDEQTTYLTLKDTLKLKLV